MGSGDGHKTKEGRIFHGGYWREEQEWPIQGSKFTKYYMDSDNKLSTNNSTGSKESITFTYDPSNPVPTIGANISSLAGLRPVDTKLRSPHEVPPAARRYNIVEPGGFNQKQEKKFYGTKEPYSNLSERLDVLTFQSELLLEDTEITGPIESTLFVSSDCVDTDFTVKLIDVYPSTKDFPDGFSLNLTDGIIRMRYRNSFSEEEFIKENEIYEIKIILYPTSNIFKKGHKIRVDVSSSNYPKFDFNPNTGEPIGLNTQQIVANNTVHFSEKHPSHITLPIIQNK